MITYRIKCVMTAVLFTTYFSVNAFNWTGLASFAITATGIGFSNQSFNELTPLYYKVQKKLDEEYKKITTDSKPTISDSHSETLFSYNPHTMYISTHIVQLLHLELSNNPTLAQSINNFKALGTLLLLGGSIATYESLSNTSKSLAVLLLSIITITGTAEGVRSQLTSQPYNSNLVVNHLQLSLGSIGAYASIRYLLS